MNPVKLYSVKEAAEIIGVSTNTLYKYLLEGRLKSARGTARQGRFRIPHSALEDFLGTPISTTPAPTPISTINDPQSTISSSPVHDQQSINYNPKLGRILLLCGLLGLIADLLFNPSWNIASGLVRLLIFACLIAFAYHPRLTYHV